MTSLIMLTLLVSTATELPAWTMGGSFYNSKTPTWHELSRYTNTLGYSVSVTLSGTAHTHDYLDEQWTGFGQFDWDPIGWSDPFKGDSNGNVFHNDYTTGVASVVTVNNNETWVLEWESGGMYGEEYWSSNGVTVKRLRDLLTFLQSNARKL